MWDDEYFCVSARPLLPAPALALNRAETPASALAPATPPASSPVVPTAVTPPSPKVQPASSRLSQAAKIVLSSPALQLPPKIPSDKQAVVALQELVGFTREVYSKMPRLSEGTDTGKKGASAKAAGLNKLKRGLLAAGEELKHCGAMLADGMAELQDGGQTGKAALQPLEKCAVALMAGIVQIGQLTATSTALSQEAAVAAAESPKVAPVQPEQRQLMDRLGGGDLMEDVRVARQLLQMKIEQQEQELRALHSSKRLLQHKLQESGQSLHHVEETHQGAQAQLSSLQQIVAKGQGDKASMARKLAKCQKKSEDAHLKVLKLEKAAQDAEAQVTRLSERCRLLESRGTSTPRATITTPQLRKMHRVYTARSRTESTPPSSIPERRTGSAMQVVPQAPKSVQSRSKPRPHTAVQNGRTKFQIPS